MDTEFLLKVSQVAVPVFSAVIAAYSSITVAKLNTLQKELKTNHGSKNIGDAIDMINVKVDLLTTNQNEISSMLRLMRNTDSVLKERIDLIETNQQVLRKHK